MIPLAVCFFLAERKYVKAVTKRSLCQCRLQAKSVRLWGNEFWGPKLIHWNEISFLIHIYHADSMRNSNMNVILPSKFVCMQMKRKQFSQTAQNISMGTHTRARRLHTSDHICGYVKWNRPSKWLPFQMNRNIYQHQNHTRSICLHWDTHCKHYCLLDCTHLSGVKSP